MLEALYKQDGEVSKSAILLTAIFLVISIIMIIWAIQGELTPDKVKESGLIDWLQTGGAIYIGDRWSKEAKKIDGKDTNTTNITNATNNSTESS